jgi:asparagine synthase (glutamine-hydrolysing)
VLRRIGRALSSVEGDLDATTLGLFRWITPEWIARLFDLSLEEAHRILEEPFRHDLERCPVDDPVQRCLWLEQRFFLGDHNLDYIDKATMAHGVEARVPFLDEELTALAAANSRHLMVRAKPKSGLLRALAPSLPPAIVARPKSGFGTALRSRFADDLGEAAKDLLSAKSVDNRGLMDVEAVRSLVDLNSLGRVDAVYPILALMVVELWCRTFVDRHDVSEPLGDQW